MNRTNGIRAISTAALCILAAELVLAPSSAKAQAEETFPVLTIGTHTYTNVTVTTKAKTYVMLMHSAGIASLKVSELTPEAMELLGYARPEKPKAQPGSAVWAREKMASLNTTNVAAATKQLEENWKERSAQALAAVHAMDRRFYGVISGAVILCHFLLSFCLMKICQKTGKEPGFLIWLPWLQVFPLLKAAGMSSLWIFGFPLGITQIVWCFKIASARGKGAMTGFCLLFPLTSLFAFLYLVFADGAPAKEEKKDRRIEVMTLETA